MNHLPSRRRMRRPLVLMGVPEDVKFRAHLESLESRELLSAATVDAGQAFALPDLTAAPLVSHPSPVGLNPSQVRQAYGLNQVSFKQGAIAGDGSGQTIAIVVAYDDPNIASDLRQFDLQYGLADPPSFQKYVQAGLTQTDSGWSLETALDVEWAHAMAPKANIVLVEAKSASLNDLFGAVNFARSLGGVSVVSMSWGTNEFYGESLYDSLFTTPAGHIGGGGLPGGVTFVAASGDSGAWNGPSYPATSPNVLSVGATSLRLGTNASYVSEQGWSGSTGGFSAVEPAPAYQKNVQIASGLAIGRRTTPDVSAVGDPSTGVSVYTTVPYNGQSGWFSVGGTSASAPQWAGLVAVANQGLALAGKGSLGNTQSALYSLPSSAFHPVTSGSNGYLSTAGYDLVTGLGTPIAGRVVSGLLATQNVYNVTGFPAPVSIIVNGHSVVSLVSVFQGTGTGGTNGQGSNGIGVTTNFPIFPPNITIVIVPIGGTQILVILPPVAINPPLFASSSHPIQTQLSNLNLLSIPSDSAGNHFGQDVLYDGYRKQPLRLGSAVEFSDFVDVEDRFQPIAVGRRMVLAMAPGADSWRTSDRGTQTQVVRWLGLQLGEALSVESEDVTASSRRALPERGRPIGPESESDSKNSLVAGVAIVAGGGYWLGHRSRHRGPRGGGSLRSFSPRLRRCLISQ